MSKWLRILAGDFKKGKNTLFSNAAFHFPAGFMRHENIGVTELAEFNIDSAAGTFACQFKDGRRLFANVPPQILQQINAAIFEMNSGRIARSIKRYTWDKRSIILSSLGLLFVIMVGRGAMENREYEVVQEATREAALVDRVTKARIEMVQAWSETTQEYFSDVGGDDNKLIQTAQHGVAYNIQNPDNQHSPKFTGIESVEFRNVIVKRYYGGKIVCGEVDGKNASGQYTGYTPFAAGIMSKSTGEFGAVLQFIKDEDKNSFLRPASTAAVDAACSQRQQ